MGDALAVALLDARGFRAEDFARSHPGGALGRKLLTHVSDVMRSGDAIPRVWPTATFSELMREMSAKGLGATAVVTEDGTLMGIFTDGDLRRLVEQGTDLRAKTAVEVMHANPCTIPAHALAVDAADLMEARRITSVLVVDDAGRLCDGGLQFTAEGETSKRFNTLDGHGLKLLQKAGITPAVVTGRDSPALRLRLQALGIEQARFGTEDKHPAAQEILNALGLGWEQAAAMGDDWPDLPMMLRCAFAAAPLNAHVE
eukprot:gene34701-biopygen22419